MAGNGSGPANKGRAMAMSANRQMVRAKSLFIAESFQPNAQEGVNSYRVSGFDIWHSGGRLILPGERTINCPSLCSRSSTDRTEVS